MSNWPGEEKLEYENENLLQRLDNGFAAAYRNWNEKWMNGRPNSMPPFNAYSNYSNSKSRQLQQEQLLPKSTTEQVLFLQNLLQMLPSKKHLLMDLADGFVGDDGDGAAAVVFPASFVLLCCVSTVLTRYASKQSRQLEKKC